MTSSSNIYFSTGAVGIGSSAPAYALDVNGSVNVGGRITSVAQSGLTTALANVSNFTINFDISTYTMVEIIFNLTPNDTSNTSQTMYLQANSSTNLYEFTSYTWKLNTSTPVLNNANIMVPNYVSYNQFSINGVVRIFKAPSGGRTSVDARVVFTTYSVGCSRVDVMASHTSALSSLYFSSTTNMNGSYIVKNYL